MSEERKRRRGTRHRGSEDEVRALAAFIKLLRAAHWASLRAGAARQEAGFTEAQFGALEAIHHLGPLIQTDLAAKLLSSTSNLTMVIDNLERDGLVERRPRREDRRCQEIHLTPKGKRAVVKVFPAHASRILRIMSSLSPAEQEHLGSLCRKLGRAAANLD